LVKPLANDWTSPIHFNFPDVSYMGGVSQTGLQCQSGFLVSQVRRGAHLVCPPADPSRQPQTHPGPHS
jgi:hypothetical protein